MDDIIKTAFIAAKKASTLINNSYGEVFLFNKSLDDLKDYVTDIDKQVELLISQEISKSFPTHSIAGEEHGSFLKRSEYKWVIDPIDGTKNFVRRLGQFAISIGITKNNVPYAGLIYDPLDHICVWAIDKKGAFINKKKTFISKTRKLEDACIAINFGKTREIRGYSLKALKNIIDTIPIIRTPGSTAFAIKELVQGKFDALIDNGNFWDFAAALVIIKEAGGAVTTWSGEEVSENSRFVVWSNGQIHNELLSKLSSLLPPALDHPRCKGYYTSKV